MSRLPALTNLPSIVRKATAAYVEGVALLDKLNLDLAAVCGTNPQLAAERADQALMLAALGRGADPVSVGTPNETARRTREAYGSKAVEAQHAHVRLLEHELGLLLLEHREAVIAHVDPAIDPAAAAYLKAIEALSVARAGFASALGLQTWAASINNRSRVPSLGDGELDFGPNVLLGISEVRASDLLDALRTDANRAVENRKVEAAQAIVVAREAANEAASAAESAARKVIEDAKFNPETGKVIPRQPVAA